MKQTLRRTRFALVTLVVFAFVARPSATANTQSKCLRAKLRAIGKKEAGLLSCFARVAAKGHANTLGACVQKGEHKYTAAFAKAGSCSGDRTICDCLAENCAIAVRVALPDAGPSHCESARLRAAGKKAAGKLSCNAKAAARGLTVDRACIQKVEARYRAAFAKTTGCTGDQATVETIANQRCVGEVGADPTGGGTISALCTSHACDGVDVRAGSGPWPRAAD
jgi:hypothetical protein